MVLLSNELPQDTRLPRNEEKMLAMTVTVTPGRVGCRARCSLERYCLPVHCWACLALKILGLKIKLSRPKLRLPFRLQKRYFGGIIPARPA